MDETSREDDLTDTDKEFFFQIEEKEKWARELIIANKELAFQNKAKEERAAELITANKELAFQNEEKEKRAAELITANKELAFQNKEKEKRARELITANKELAFQNEEKEKRAAELITANKELAFQNKEKEKRAAELIVANIELERAEGQQKEYIQSLEEMMYMTSHKLRSPIANILGILNYLDSASISKEEVKEMRGFLKQSAQSLDQLTRELATFIYNEEMKLKKNGEV